MSGVRARFVRDVVDLLEREHGKDDIEGAFAKLGSRLGSAGDLTALRATPPSDAIPLSEAEEILLGLDATLGDGSGQLLELAATEYFARVLATGNMAVPGDLMATVARLRAPLEHVFVEQHVPFDLAGSTLGFSMFLSVAGRPRAARLLRHLSVGAVRAAQRYARQGMEDGVKIRAEALGERVRIDVLLRDETRLTPTEITVPVDPTARSRTEPIRRTSKPHLASTQPTLDAVERIIARSATTANARARANNRRTDPMPRATSSVPPAESGAPPPRTSGFHPSAEIEEVKPPTSKRSK